MATKLSDNLNGGLPIMGEALLSIALPPSAEGFRSDHDTGRGRALLLKEPTMNDVFEGEIERMEKLGYTEEEIVRQIQAMLRVQDMVVYATL